MATEITAERCYIITDVESRLEIALGALADIAYSGDMTLDVARAKAKRIYDMLREASQPTAGKS